MADSAVAHGIATPEQFDGWRQALNEWKDHPGAFAGWPDGRATGRKR